MAERIIKSKSSKAGAAPGTLVHIGRQRIEQVRIQFLHYGPDLVEERSFDSLDACREAQVWLEERLAKPRESYVTWINVDGLHQVEVLEHLGDCFGLHPLLLEDVLNTEQRPKMEDYGGYLYIVLKMLAWQKKRNFSQVDIDQLSLILGENYVLSFQEKPGTQFNPVRERIQNNKSRIRNQGADYLAYSLMDATVDHYYDVLERLGEQLEGFEREIVTNPNPHVLKHLHASRRQLILLRRAVWPLRDLISILSRSESPLVEASLQVYLRDLYDHAVQIMDAVESIRDMTGGLMDIYLSMVSNRMNEIMKVLTIIATIFIPLTFITGIYGMNFEYMPELHQPYAYPIVLSVMFLVAVGMLAWFRRMRWI